MHSPTGSVAEQDVAEQDNVNGESPAKPRTFFWPAFTVTLLVWLLASCGGMAVFIGLDELSLSDLQAVGPIWTPPPLPTEAILADEPAEQVARAAGEGGEVARFQPGAQAANITSSRVNIRREPGHLGKPADDVLAQMQPGETVEILGWPRSADNLVWWPIRYTGEAGLVEGWVAESTASGVQILSPVP